LASFFIVRIVVVAVVVAVVVVDVDVRKNLLKYPGHYNQRFRVNGEEVWDDVTFLPQKNLFRSILLDSIFLCVHRLHHKQLYLFNYFNSTDIAIVS
jgi:hypothetical protein